MIKRALIGGLIGGVVGFTVTMFVRKAKPKIEDDLAMARTLREIRAL